MTGRRYSSLARTVRSREWRARNPLTAEQKAARNALSKAWAASNRAHVQSLQKAWKATNIEYYKQYCLFTGARRRARQTGLAFEIAIEDAKIPALCPVFGK